MTKKVKPVRMLRAIDFKCANCGYVMEMVPIANDADEKAFTKHRPCTRCHKGPMEKIQ